MKRDENLRFGQKIQVEIDRDHKIEQYVSRIEEVIDDKSFIIARPIGNGNYTPLTPGQVMRVIYDRKDAKYYFNAVVLERIRSRETISGKIAVISEIKKLQRRNYFRLEVILQATVTYKEDGKKYVRKMEAVDISGGGIKVVSKHKLPIGCETEVLLDIDNIREEVIRCRVVRSIESPGFKNMFEMGLEFVDISERVRQAIICYIFERQRDILKKGLITP